MPRRGKDVERSEGRFVMNRIGIDAGHRDPQTGPARKSADVPQVLDGEKSVKNLLKSRNVDMLAESSEGPRLDHAMTAWHNIVWAQRHRAVRKLQTRIAKAVQQGRWRAVRRLQRLLTRSFSAKCLAVLRVTENRGRKTPGVDGVTWDTPEAKSSAVAALGKRSDRPLPLRRIYIPKKNGKKRPLSIPAMKDRAHQALHLLGLEPIAETQADPNSYGFRPARSTADAIAQCFTLLSRRISPRWILEGDIQGCFDNIDKAWIEVQIPMDRTLLRSWLDAGSSPQGVVPNASRGSPRRNHFVHDCEPHARWDGTVVAESFSHPPWPSERPSSFRALCG